MDDLKTRKAELKNQFKQLYRELKKINNTSELDRFNSLLKYANSDNNNIDNLFALNPKDVNMLGLTGKTVPIRVYKAYDGDTCSCLFKFKGEVYKYKGMRLTGIDTPEMRGSSPEVKDIAICARNRLRELILDQRGVTAEFGEMDKYGRPLVKIFRYYPDDNINVDINQLLIDERLAVIYDGGTKFDWEDEEIRKKIIN